MKSTSYFALAFLVAASTIAQQVRNDGDAAASAVPTRPPALAALEYSRPKVLGGVGTDAMVLGRYACGNDGSTYAFVQGNTSSRDGNQSGLALLGIRSDGTVRNFEWSKAPGFASVTMPRSIFADNGHLYVLVEGERLPQQEGLTSRSIFVLRFGAEGNLERAIPLRPDLNPWTFGVFPSGRMLLVSEDRLNHRMALDLTDDSGNPVGELPLGDNDLVEKAAQQSASSPGRPSLSPTFLIMSSKLVSRNGHLLLVPLDTSGIPILELGESGVVSTVSPHIPATMVLEEMLGASESGIFVQMGKVLERGNPRLDANGELVGLAVQPLPRITEISRSDGSIVREMDLGSGGVIPTCESGGIYQLLTSDAHKELQVVTAQGR